MYLSSERLCSHSHKNYFFDAFCLLRGSMKRAISDANHRKHPPALPERPFKLHLSHACCAHQLSDDPRKSTEENKSLISVMLPSFLVCFRATHSADRSEQA
ncbi:hypothetical protein BD410DRAFT_637193 [Rickenella mellea]|uniref:Uncharacterized protein n=1 Tax=Rickenella mellea TaxID=50990 RepID=A0A4Y7QD85_9AGAM|nr:hypothetical protein BD410DRAFT_637193 [Rickenella mellea]